MLTNNFIYLAMRVTAIAILSLIGSLSLLAQSLGLQSFSASAEGNNVTVRFVSQNETGISSFYIERAKEGTDNFVMVTELSPLGNYKSYSYTDEGPFLKPSKGEISKNSEDVYVYRIKARYSNGSFAFSDRANVTHKTSSVTKTWGMIKEMFR
jgi:hypothetical protein